MTAVREAVTSAEQYVLLIHSLCMESPAHRRTARSLSLVVSRYYREQKLTSRYAATLARAVNARTDTVAARWLALWICDSMRDALHMKRGPLFWDRVGAVAALLVERGKDNVVSLADWRARPTRERK